MSDPIKPLDPHARIHDGLDLEAIQHALFRWNDGYVDLGAMDKMFASIPALIAEIRRLRATPCPHISSSDEGTNSCDLAGVTGEELRNLRGECQRLRAENLVYIECIKAALEDIEADPTGGDAQRFLKIALDYKTKPTPAPAPALTPAPWMPVPEWFGNPCIIAVMDLSGGIRTVSKSASSRDWEAFKREVAMSGPIPPPQPNGDTKA